MRSAGRSVRLGIAAALLAGQVPAAVLAGFSSAPAPPSMSVSTGTLAAPTGGAAANQNCTPLASTEVRVTWTATTSAFADGYEVLRALVSGGPYVSLGTVAGLSTTAFTDTSVVFSTSYFYVVRATKNNWRSANSNEASVTTPTSLCA